MGQAGFQLLWAIESAVGWKSHALIRKANIMRGCGAGARASLGPKRATGASLTAWGRNASRIPKCLIA